MTRIYSDLPKPVMQALLEQGGYELSDEKHADIKILSSQFKEPYRIGEIIDAIASNSNKLSINGIEFDLAEGIAKSGRKKITLTGKESDIIRLLANSGTPLSREELLKRIWQYASDATTNTVETHIYRLRQKLSENFGLEVIDTVGSNYQIRKNGK